MTDVRAEVLKILNDYIHENGSNESIYGDFLMKSFTEYSINSLQFIQAVIKLEELFGIEFDEEMLDMYNYNTIGDFVKSMEELVDKNE